MKHKARVTWVQSSEGGRASLPENQRYVTIAKFAEDGAGWPDGAWSVVLDFAVPPLVQGSPSVGEASFLMENAPQQRIQRGRRFDLYEGLKKVAVVELIDGS